jgi:hypothetical protein
MRNGRAMDILYHNNNDYVNKIDLTPILLDPNSSDFIYFKMVFEYAEIESLVSCDTI